MGPAISVRGLAQMGSSTYVYGFIDLSPGSLVYRVSFKSEIAKLDCSGPVTQRAKPHETRDESTNRES